MAQPPLFRAAVAFVASTVLVACLRPTTGDAQQAETSVIADIADSGSVDGAVMADALEPDLPSAPDAVVDGLAPDVVLVDAPGDGTPPDGASPADGLASDLPPDADATTDVGEPEVDAGEPVIDCATAAPATPCDDLDPCTTDDSCVDGACQGTSVCASFEGPCNAPTCDPRTLICSINPWPAGTPCDDGDACTAEDTCGSSGCVGEAIDVDDSNPCTLDACVNGLVEHTIDVGADCTIPETEPCSGDGVCNVLGICMPPDGCQCDTDADCPTPTNLCVGPLVCDTSGDTPTCVADPDNFVTCPIPSGSCKQQLCDAATGGCFEQDAPDGALCTDQNACTTNDACVAGQCVGEPVACDDGLWCNGIETCDPAAGCQQGIAPTVDDGIDCTIDVCDDDTDTVTHTPDDAFCDDDDACTGVEICSPQWGACIVTSGPPIVDDGIACTNDTCDPITGVSNIPDDSLCSDDDVCNGVEVCDPDQGGCALVAPALVADDGVECTADSCDPIAGVTNVPDDTLCDDGNACTGTETCDAAAGCLAGTVVDCDDGVFCNGVEVCNASDGSCGLGTPADDDGLGCTADSCDEATTTVTHVDLCAAPQSCSAQTGLCDGGEVWTDITGTINTNNGEIGGVVSDAWQGGGLFIFDGAHRIPAGATVNVVGSAPLQLVVNGGLQVVGDLMLDGKDGASIACGNYTAKGATSANNGGGSSGGNGGSCLTSNSGPQDGKDGLGPGGGGGGGLGGKYPGAGGGGGHTFAGGGGSPFAPPAGGANGAAYGAMGELHAGSGGGGAACAYVGSLFTGTFVAGASGGSGGGAVLLESTTTNVSIEGTISVRGGDGGDSETCYSSTQWDFAYGASGGAGSGGTIIVRAAGAIIFNGAAALDADGGDGGTSDRIGGNGSYGRIHLVDEDGAVPTGTATVFPEPTFATY